MCFGPKKKNPPKNKHKKVRPTTCPTCASFEADNLKFLDSIKVFDGLNQKQKDTSTRRHGGNLKTPPVVECHVLFFTCVFLFPNKKKGRCVFFGGGGKEVENG